MIFGDKQFFAIEVGLCDSRIDDLRLGYFHYWLADIAIGDRNSSIRLGDVLTSTTWIMHDCGRREHAEFFKMDKSDLLSQLDLALYVGRGDAFGDRPEEEEWARFDIIPRIESFNYCKMFMVDNETSSRVVAQIGSGQVLERFIPLRAFDKALKSAIENIKLLVGDTECAPGATVE